MSFLFISNVTAQEPSELIVKFEGQDVISRVLIPDHMTVKEAKEALYQRQVEYVEEQTGYESALIPDDPSFLQQWYLMQINAPDVWDFVPQKEEIVVAVLDTGVDLYHPELQGRIWNNVNEIPSDGIDNDRNGYIDDVNGWDFVNYTNMPIPRVDGSFNKEGVMHGTLISGIIAANTNNVFGGAGIASHVKIMPLRVLDSAGHGEAAGVINAINYAVKEGADIINLSFVGAEQSSLMRQTLLSAYQKGILIVAAAGNNRENGGINLDERPMYPICYDNHESVNYILGVAATDRNDVKSFFSNYGSCVDISAPGQDFFGVQYVNAATSDFTDSFGGPWAGTSLAAPVVSGTAALLKSAYPNLTVDALTQALLQGVNPVDTIQGNASYIGKLGTGRVNTFLAALQAQQLGDSLPKQSVVRGDSRQQFSFFVAPQSQRVSEVIVYDKESQKQNTILTYDNVYQQGLELISGDINGDGKKEIVTAPHVGGGPHVRVFSEDGFLVTHFMAFDPSTRSGANIATCDVNQDGKEETVVGTGAGMSPLIRIFYHRSEFEFGFTEFIPYDDVNYKKGIRVSCADVDGDDVPEVIAGIDTSQPHIRIFNIDGQLLSQFRAFDPGVGINVTSCDLDDNGKAEIIVSHKEGGDPTVRVFHQKSTDLYQFTEFVAYGETFKGGVNIACGDVNRDGFLDILTGAGVGGGPHVRWFDMAGNVLGQLFSFKPEFRGGVKVGVF